MAEGTTVQVYIDAMSTLGRLMAPYDEGMADILEAEALYVKKLGNRGAGIPLSQSGFPSKPSLESDMEKLSSSSKKESELADEYYRKIVGTGGVLSEEEIREMTATSIACVNPGNLERFLSPVYYPPSEEYRSSGHFFKKYSDFGDDGVFFSIKNIHEVSDYKYPAMDDKRSFLRFVGENIPESIGLGVGVYITEFFYDSGDFDALLIGFAFGFLAYGFSFIIGGCVRNKNLLSPILKDVPSYLGKKCYILANELNNKRLTDNPDEIPFIKGPVTKEEEICRYVYHHPKANNKFGLDFPVLVKLDDKGNVSLSTEPEYQEALSGFLEGEEGLRRFIGSMYSSGGIDKNLPSVKDTYFIGGSKDLSCGDEGIKKLLSFALDYGNSIEGELIALDRSQIEGVSGMLQEVTNLYPVEPNEAFVDALGQVYPPPVVWLSDGQNDSKYLKNFQEMITGYLSGGETFSSRLKDKKVVNEVAGIISRNYRTEINFRYLPSAYFVCGKDQLSLEAPEAVFRILKTPYGGGELKFREKVNTVLSNYKGEAILSKPSLILEDKIDGPEDKRDGPFVAGELGRAYVIYKDIASDSYKESKDKSSEILRKNKIKADLNRAYGESITGLMRELKGLYVPSADR